MNYKYFSDINTAKDLIHALEYFGDDALVFVDDGKKHRAKIDFVDCVDENENIGLKKQVLININVEE